MNKPRILYHEDKEWVLKSALDKLTKENALYKATLESEYFVKATAYQALKEDYDKLKAELWVAKDSQLRTYDGMAQKADRADELEEINKELQRRINILVDLVRELNPILTDDGIAEAFADLDKLNGR